MDGEIVLRLFSLFLFLSLSLGDDDDDGINGSTSSSIYSPSLSLSLSPYIYTWYIFAFSWDERIAPSLARATQPIYSLLVIRHRSWQRPYDDDNVDSPRRREDASSSSMEAEATRDAVVAADGEVFTVSIDYSSSTRHHDPRDC